MNTGERLKALRILQGLTLEEVAKAVGTIKQTIYKYEHNVITNIPQEKLELLARVLDTTPAYLLCFTDDPIEGRVDSRLSKVFRERLGDIIANKDSSDLQTKLGTRLRYQDIIDGKSPLTLNKACDIANELGISLDYLTGLTNKQNERILSMPPEFMDLNINLRRADYNLMDTVHKICGMNEFDIAKDILSGRFSEIWDSRKIDVVKEFIKNNEKTLHMMFDAVKTRNEELAGDDK